MTILLVASLRLPLVELPVEHPATPWFAVFLSGDGGWRAIDVETSEELNRHGIPVVGFLSDDYFDTRRTPAGISHDVTQVVETYAAKWKKSKVILIGFSRGADALPLALAGMPPATRNRVVLTALLSPALEAQMERVSWWELGKSAPPEVALAPVVRSLKGERLLCVHGEEESDSLCDAVRGAGVIDVKTRGSHHLDRDYVALARTILAALPEKP
jgi:type IV secretory pathway VirJ component